MENFVQTPHTNEHTLRDLITIEYYDALDAAVNIERWYNTTQSQRRGNVRRYQTAFLVSFAKLFSMTRYITQMRNNESLASQIDIWSSQPKTDEKYFYLAGVSLFHKWVRALYEQRIVELR